MTTPNKAAPGIDILTAHEQGAREPNLHPQTYFFLQQALGDAIPPEVTPSMASTIAGRLIAEYRDDYADHPDTSREWALTRADVAEAYANGWTSEEIKKAYALDSSRVKPYVGHVMSWLYERQTGQPRSFGYEIPLLNKPKPYTYNQAVAAGAGLALELGGEVHPQTQYILQRSLSEATDGFSTTHEALREVTRLLEIYRAGHAHLTSLLKVQANKRADFVQAFAGGASVEALQAEYSYTSTTTVRNKIKRVTQWLRANIDSQGQRIESSLPTLQIDDSLVAEGSAYLGSLFRHTSRGWSSLAKIARVTEFFAAHKEVLCGDCDIDLHRAARFIIRTVTLHNEGREHDPSTTIIPDDLQTTGAILAAYVQNIRGLERYMTRNNAVVLARSISAREYPDMIAEFHDKTGLTPTQIQKICLLKPTNPRLAMEEIAQVQTILRRDFSSTFSSSEIRQMLSLYGCSRTVSRAVDAANLYVSEVDELLAMAKSCHPSASKSDIRWFFVMQVNPVDKVKNWIEAMRYTSNTWGLEHPLLPYNVLNRLFRHPSGLTPHNTVSNYMERFKELRGISTSTRAHLPKPYLMYWAWNTPKKYRASLENHVELYKKISRLLEESGLSIDPVTLNYLTFKNRNSRKINTTVKQFVAQRLTLADDTEGNPWIQSWMIDSAAASANLTAARSQLNWLARLNRLGILTPGRSLTVELDARALHGEGNTWHEMTPDQTKGVDGATARRSLAQLLDRLPAYEAAAVRCIFSLPTDFTEEELSDSFGVPISEFEELVRSRILPKLLELANSAPRDI